MGNLRDRLTRRRLLAAALAASATSLLPARRAAAEAVTPPPSLGPGAECGWASLDFETGRAHALNPDLRLPMCSSFKWLLAACVLARVDAGREQLERPLELAAAQVLPNSPTVAAALQASGGRRTHLSVAALCEAAVTVSDNAAANALLAQIGGPPALTDWLRYSGDAVTRLDREEPDLNHVPRGDVRDTTTAAAMLGNLQRIVYGEVLRPESRERLFGWLLGCQTGLTRLRAGLPAGWKIAHKTGTMSVERGHDPVERAAAGDVGILLPPRGKPILIAAYTAGSEQGQPDVERWFAELARAVTALRATPTPDV